MYRVLTGKQRSLVFPVMCNGHIKVDYSDNTPRGQDNTFGSGTDDDDITHGVWSLKDSFTIETTVTPYDVNGYGRHSVGSLSGVSTDSKKVMPAIEIDDTKTNYVSNYYLSEVAKRTHEMIIFHSANAKLSLINTTLHNENQPAEYKISFSVTIGTTTSTITSDAVILPSSGINWNLASHTDNSYPKGIFNSAGKYTHVYGKTTLSSGNSGNTLAFVSTANDVFHKDQELFIKNGFGFTSLGTVASAPTSSSPFTVTLNTSQSTAFNSTDIYIKAPMNPSYIESFNHIAATYDSVSKTMNIYFDGNKITSGLHSTGGSFVMDKSDLFLASNGNGSTGADSATANKQFMGELHEFSISSGAKDSFTTFSLTPRYANTMLYFRFEEVDL